MPSRHIYFWITVARLEFQLCRAYTLGSTKLASRKVYSKVKIRWTLTMRH